jgi:predicted glycosyltransferase
MAAEAGILGTPSFYVSNVRGQNCADLEKYGLVYTYTELDPLINKIQETLSDENFKQTWMDRRNRMLEDKVDLTGFLCWFVEHFPKSLDQVRRHPELLKKYRQPVLS